MGRTFDFNGDKQKAAARINFATKLKAELMAAANVRPPSDRRPGCPCLFFWGTSAALFSMFVPSR